MKKPDQETFCLLLAIVGICSFMVLVAGMFTYQSVSFGYSNKDFILSSILLVVSIVVILIFAGFTWEYYRNKTFKVRSQAIKENIAAGSKLSKGKLP